MKRKEMLDWNDWNVHQLARVVTEAPKDIHYIWPKIEETCAWAESLAGVAGTKSFKSSLKASVQVAIIAATEVSVGVSTVIAAILAPFFLQGLVRKAAIQRRFDLKVVAILVELNKLKRCKLRCDTILNCNHAPDVVAARILAVLLQVCDIIRVSYSGVPLGNVQSELIYDASARILLDLQLFYIPLVHRMRLYNIQAKLADFWLKHTDALSYYSITAKIGMTRLQRQQKLDLISEEVYSAVQAHGIDFILKKRIKSIYSIWNKIQRLKVEVDQIHDLAAIRIILTGVDGKTLQEEKIACWKVLSIVSDLYHPICNVMRDWISIPRDSSYESLHLVFETYRYGRLEMQVRTARMDDIAEHGQAAHWKYKYLD